jgi:hypothetical protein
MFFGDCSEWGEFSTASIGEYDIEMSLLLLDRGE